MLGEKAPWMQAGSALPWEGCQIICAFFLAAIPAFKGPEQVLISTALMLLSTALSIPLLISCLHRSSRIFQRSFSQPHLVPNSGLPTYSFKSCFQIYFLVGPFPRCNTSFHITSVTQNPGVTHSCLGPSFTFAPLTRNC